MSQVTVMKVMDIVVEVVAVIEGEVLGEAMDDQGYVLIVENQVTS